IVPDVAGRHVAERVGIRHAISIVFSKIRRGGGEDATQIHFGLGLARLSLIGHEVRDGDRRQDPDDRDHDHQLDQGKAPIPFNVSHHQLVLLFSESFTPYDRAYVLLGRTLISFLGTRSARPVPSPYELKQARNQEDGNTFPLLARTSWQISLPLTTQICR